MAVSIRTTQGYTDLYALFRGVSTAVVMTPLAGADAGWYVLRDVDVAATELAAGTYEGAILHGSVDGPSADDPQEGVFSDFVWDGSATVDRLEDISDDAATAATEAGAANSAANTAASRASTIIDTLADIQAAAAIPVSQVPVPLSRTWTLKLTPDGLVGEVPLVRTAGESQVFAIDFRADLAANGRLVSLDDVEIVSGEADGLEFPDDDGDRGVDRSEAKLRINLVTAGTYIIRCEATYDSSDGGGTSEGRIKLIVKAAA